MKKILLIVIFFSLVGIINARSQLVIATMGGRSQSVEIYFKCINNESVITSLVVGNIIHNQGLQQPKLVVNTVKTTEGLPYTIEAFPNSTYDLIIIRLTKTNFGNFRFLFYNIRGEVLEQHKFNSSIAAINMKIFPAGQYLLKILQQDKEITIYEIIKH